MNEEIKDDRGVETIKLFGILLPKMPSLMFRLSGMFLRFKSQANKAGKVFKKELIKQGIDKKTASELTENYLEGSHLTRYLQNLR